MAEAIFSGMLQKLSSLEMGFQKDKEKLENILTSIKATLDDAEEKRFSSHQINAWLEELKDVAYELDDLLDVYACQVLRLEYEQVNLGASDKVQCSCLSFFDPKQVAFRHKFAKKMKRVSERLEEIAEHRNVFGLIETVSERRHVSECRQTISLVTEPQVYGRDQDTCKIVDFLLGDASDSEDISIYPILGPSGLGKTTLAQLIFNHRRIFERFELRIWVCVPEDFSLMRMTKAIVEATSGDAHEGLSLSLLQRRLLDLLRYKRYLLVLDDMRDDDQENWECLRSLLSCGAKGTSILVTTRLPTVASIMGTMPPHELSALSEDDCWELFKHRAFGPNEDHPELAVIGKEIVNKCGGVPFAVKTLAGLLRFKRREKEWLYVCENTSRTNFELAETASKRRKGVTEWHQTHSLIIPQEIIARDEDKDKIINYLIYAASYSEDVSVYPIVGQGGLGKTALAKLIFNNERVLDHFDLKIWVCASEDFSLKRMTKEIIQASSSLAHENLNLDLDLLQTRVRHLLQCKRYLLVFDDVWDDEQENWQRLKSILACGAKGTSILVTTRLPTVASIMGTVPPHELSGLSENDCWELFKHEAFEPNEEEQPELVLIGREIVKKCGGVPLAVRELGRRLYLKRDIIEWLYIKENNLLSLQQTEDFTMSDLRLSYLDFPMEVRQCFAYCAIFPKEKIIEKQDLIELWMANGFISTNEILDAEDVGDDVWNDLYRRSFFQDIEHDGFGKVTSFKIRDSAHDFAQYVAGEVCCITDDNRVTSRQKRIHHLSDHRSMFNVSEESIKSMQLHLVKSLRTCILQDPHTTAQLFPHVLKCYSLHVLRCQPMEELPSSIGDLKLLRYLNLSGGNFKNLPESLCKLWNLQVLKLDGCQFLQKLPNKLIRLQALQHISLNSCCSLSSLPPQIGKLTSLRNLSTYIVGKERGFLLAELGSLKLKGDLLIKHLREVKSVGDAKEANMSIKQLNKLSLSWDNNEESKLQENVEEILEALQPDTQQLESLIVEGYKGAHFPQWMYGSSLQYLTHLELLNCESCFQLPALGKLPSLRKLNIYKAIHVKYIDEECYDVGGAFMALEYLKLEKLPNLIKLLKEDGENMFPCLSTLEVKGCPKFVAEEALPDCFGNLQLLHKLHIVDCDMLSCLPMNLSSLERLTIRGCPELEKRYNKETGEEWPKLAHIPHVKVGCDCEDSDTN